MVLKSKSYTPVEVVPNPDGSTFRFAIAGSAIKTERAMISMTASFGVTTIRADDSSVSLFKRADQALQKAKQAGRNQVVEADLAPLS